MQKNSKQCGCDRAVIHFEFFMNSMGIFLVAGKPRLTVIVVVGGSTLTYFVSQCGCNRAVIRFEFLMNSMEICLVTGKPRLTVIVVEDGSTQTYFVSIFLM